MRKGACFIDINTKVRIKLAATEALITAILLRADGYYVSYECSYFNGLEHKQVWLVESEFEVITDGPSYVTIGFK